MEKEQKNIYCPETMKEYKEWLAWIGKNQQEWIKQQENNKFGPLFATNQEEQCKTKKN